jgi:hypothetical protein
VGLLHDLIRLFVRLPVQIFGENVGQPGDDTQFVSEIVPKDSVAYLCPLFPSPSLGNVPKNRDYCSLFSQSDLPGAGLNDDA